MSLVKISSNDKMFIIAKSKIEKFPECLLYRRLNTLSDENPVYCTGDNELHVDIDEKSLKYIVNYIRGYPFQHEDMSIDLINKVHGDSKLLNLVELENLTKDHISQLNKPIDYETILPFVKMAKSFIECSLKKYKNNPKYKWCNWLIDALQEIIDFIINPKNKETVMKSVNHYNKSRKYISSPYWSSSITILMSVLMTKVTREIFSSDNLFPKPKADSDTKPDDKSEAKSEDILQPLITSFFSKPSEQNIHTLIDDIILPSFPLPKEYINEDDTTDSTDSNDSPN
jgi:hypothetical protein